VCVEVGGRKRPQLETTKMTWNELAAWADLPEANMVGVCIG